MNTKKREEENISFTFLCHHLSVSHLTIPENHINVSLPFAADVTMILSVSYTSLHETDRGRGTEKDTGGGVRDFYYLV